MTDRSHAGARWGRNIMRAGFKNLNGVFFYLLGIRLKFSVEGGVSAAGFFFLEKLLRRQSRSGHPLSRSLLEKKVSTKQVINS